MPRQRFFLKVYLGFWTAIILVLAALMALDWLTHTGPRFGFPRHFMEDLLTLYGQQALAVQGLGDPEATAKLAARLEAAPGLRAYLLGPDGQGVDDRQPSQELRRLAALAMAGQPQEAWLEDGQPAMALPLTDARGVIHVAVGGMTSRPLGPPDETGMTIALKLAFILLVSGVVCHLFARHITSPLLHLTQVTRRFAGGDLSARAGRGLGRRRDELSEVAGEFDRMADRLEALLTAQRHLLSDVSHELRSPLARLNVALELARRHAGAEALPALERMEIESRALNELIGQILALSRLDSEVIVVERRPLDLALLLRQVAEDAAFEAQGRGCSVRAEPSPPCLVLGDADLMRRAVENVVRNAVRYTRPDSEVLITLRRADLASAALAEICIRDHGPGAPDDDLPFLFRPFFRVSQARERQSGGSGLGLAITERAVRLHHGMVWAANAEGGGLQVFILLPAPSAGLAAG